MATKGIIDRDLGLKKIIRELKKLDGAEVTIGLHEDTGDYPGGTPVRDVGFFLEFGTIKMPARSWLRSVFDKKTKKLNAAARRGLSAIYSGVNTAKRLIDGLGREFASDVKNNIVGNKVRPKTTAATLAKKDTQITLADTFRLHDEVKHKVKI